MPAKPQFPDEQSEEGEFQRQEDAFREWISADGSTPYPAAPDRYHLYISLACPWASRTLIVRGLKGLEQTIGVTVVDPIRDERGWAFRNGPGYSTDPVNGFAFLSEAYVATDPGFDGRVTVPVLWDTADLYQITYGKYAIGAYIVNNLEQILGMRPIARGQTSLGQKVLLRPFNPSND